MIQVIRQNIQFYIILSIWLITGMYAGVAVYAVLPLTIILLARKQMYLEIIVGYLFILLLADSSIPRLFFAKNVKDIYISLLSLVFFLNYKYIYKENILFKIFLPFLLFSFFTMCFAWNDSYFFTSIQKTLSYTLSFLVIPVIIEHEIKRDKKLFFIHITSLIFIFLISGYLMKYISPSIALIEGGRLRGVFGGPNGLGIFSVLFFILFFIINDFYPDLFSKNEKRIIYLLIILSAVGSGSRNALIAIAVFYVFQQFFGSSPFLGFIVFIILLFVSELISSNAVAIVKAVGLESYFRIQTLEEGSGRLIAWAFAWKQIQYNFFIGRGFAYNEFYMRHHYGFLLKLNHQGGIHNSFLTFWFDQGLVGLIIYLRSYLLMFIKAAKKTKFAFPAMFAISFTAFFESWLVGSLSAFAFMGIFIFTVLTSDDIKLQESTSAENTEEK